ncbi:MAG TPA: NUDIX hydrolase [Blastocatellia bacterium]|nr:NUDIX hydrolase [Blastocatellia bacterium]
MYISAKVILELERKYGSPEELSLAYEMTEREFEMVYASQKHGRAHDVTLFIVIGGRVVVIKKPMYPPGAYRAPSGGIAPGEPFEDGARREALEETGLSISLEKYLLRARVKFSNLSRVIDWTSHVFTANRIAGELQPIDTHEIVEARLATTSELMNSIRTALLESGSTGLRYRSELNDAVIRRLIEEGRLR